MFRGHLRSLIHTILKTKAGTNKQLPTYTGDFYLEIQGFLFLENQTTKDLRLLFSNENCHLSCHSVCLLNSETKGGAFILTCALLGWTQQACKCCTWSASRSKKESRVSNRDVSGIMDGGLKCLRQVPCMTRTVSGGDRKNMVANFAPWRRGDY